MYIKIKLDRPAQYTYDYAYAARPYKNKIKLKNR